MDKKIIIGIGLFIIIGIFGFILLRPDPEIPTPVPADFDNQANCEAANFYWWNNACHIYPGLIEPEITLEMEEIFAKGEKITAMVGITNPANRYFSGEILVYFAGERIYIQVVDLPPGETIEKQVTITEEAQLGEFTLEIAGIITEIIVLDKPTIEGANVILEESIEKTLGLASFTTTGDGVFQLKDGEVIIFEIGIEDLKASVINPFDFANQDSSMVGTYNMMINFGAIADLIEEEMTPEELAELEDLMGMDLLKAIRAIGEVNISMTMEMKSIDSDSYVKIVEIDGLRDILTKVMGMFAGMIMDPIEEKIGIWHKTPADPEMEEEMMEMSEKIGELILSFFNVYYIREVLSNTEIEAVPVYNFALGISLEKIKEVIISFIPLITEKVEMEINEKEEIEAGIIEFWPKIIEVIEAMEIDYRIYICQETHFIIQDTQIVNIDLNELMVVLDPIITAEMTPEELAEFERTKSVIKNMSIVMIMNVIYSDHNAVFPIQPPEEYEVMGFPKLFPEPIMF